VVFQYIVSASDNAAADRCKASYSAELKGTSSVSIVTVLRNGLSRNIVRFPAGTRDIILSKTFSSVHGPTQLPIEKDTVDCRGVDQPEREAAYLLSCSA
jgi:hypothetical protein